MSMRDQYRTKAAEFQARSRGASNQMTRDHFDTMAQQKEAAVIGMWLFLLTEILFFGGLFVAYMIYRVWYFDAFAEASRRLSLFWGGLNTAVLIASSLTMALAVNAAQNSKRTPLVGYLIATLFLGCVFLGVKVIEYKAKFDDHLIHGYDFQWAGPLAPFVSGVPS